ncbi:MAG: hypothetical protein MHM6MM_003374 [Cercozoa sp. M6MM]
MTNSLGLCHYFAVLLPFLFSRESVVLLFLLLLLTVVIASEKVNCEERYRACYEDAECVQASLDYSAAFDCCVEKKCKLEGLSGFERMEKKDNCDHKCAVNPDDFEIPDSLDLQHVCLEVEAKGRRADFFQEAGRYEYGCYIVDKSLAAARLQLKVEKKLNKAACDFSDSATVCAKIDKSKVRPCSSAAYIKSYDSKS